MREYYLGLDMGTASVGWSVTDASYQLLRAKGKDLWGVRLFEEASTAAERRTNRVAKRMRQRKVARIALLKEFFDEEIRKVDANFFQRLEDSKYFPEHKRFESKFGIFADLNYTDKQYYEEYPTIFHLRNDLMVNEKKKDIRLVYLGILNIYKHRGHFLDKNLDGGVNDNSGDAIYHELKKILLEKIDLEFSTKGTYEELIEVLKMSGISRTKKAEQFASIVGIAKKEKAKYEIIKAICGLDIKLQAIYGTSIIDEENKSLKVGFSSASYDEQADVAKKVIGDDLYEIIDKMKQFHDIGALMNVMQGHKYLSQARIASFEKHKKDLQTLKEVIKEYAESEYAFMFQEQNEGTYSAYVKSTNSGNKVRRNVKKCTQEILYKTIEKILKDADMTDEKVTYIFREMSTEEFLPKQLTSANGIIPNQAHSAELKQILKNAQVHHTFLREKDETGLTVADKIQQIFEFQIPYYVGPLNIQHKGKGGNAWVEFKEGTSGRILPWNFEERVDTMASAEAFISKMVRHCTYLSEETCVADTSLIYEKFKVLNELNNLKINGEKISVELKQNIYNNLFLEGKKVKQKQLLNYLFGQGHIGSVDTASVEGIDGDFTNSLSSYGKFLGVFGEAMKLDDMKAMVEDIIFWGTIYGEDKKFLKKRILDKYEGKVTDQELKRICGFKFKEWGNLSRSFLELAGCDKNVGEVRSLIQMMWETNDNLMQLLSENYSFKEELESKCKKLDKTLAEFTYDDLEGSYMSTPVKRMVWQTLQIIQELETVLGAPPKKIFVEMAKGEQAKIRTVSRKNKLIELYKSCKKESRDWAKELGCKEERDFRSKKLYLYYLQKGMCMYSGAPIDLHDLFDNNKYDLDHIYPQSYVKDDSLENNMVLVDKRSNASKSDTYPINQETFEARKSLWKSLADGGFITKEKYKRLVRREPFSDDEMAGFVNRQLVETRQGSKAVTQILTQTCPESEVVYVKANNVSNFRMDSMFIENRGKDDEVDRRLVKSRLVNDFHHAHDAYLNIVVGNVYNTKFTKTPLRYIKETREQKENKQGKNPYHMDKIFRFDVKRGEEWAWRVKVDAGMECSRDTVLRMLKKATPLITFMTLSGHGAISDVQPVSAMACKEKGYMPLSSDGRLSNTRQYGGYQKVKNRFFTLVEYIDNKGNSRKKIEAMPIYYFPNVIDNERIKDYCELELGLRNVKVKYKIIPMHSELRVDGYNVRITAKQGDTFAVNNMVSLILEQRYVTYVKKISDSLENKMLKIDISREMNEELYKKLVHKHTYSILNKKNGKILETISNYNNFYELDMMEQCVVIRNILKNTELKNNVSDLTLIKGKSQVGKRAIGSKIDTYSEFKLINKSITGLFIKEVDLLTV